MKFYKNKHILLALFISGTLLFGCDDFGSTNTDPNSPSQPQTALMFTDVFRDISDFVLTGTTSIYYVQHMSSTQYASASRYESTEFSFYSWYQGPLANLKTIIDLNTDEATKVDALAGGSNANQIAVARIMKAYFYQVLTDSWGMIPYSEALQGTEEISPVYDTQQSIYMDIIKELREAAAQINTSEAGIGGDIIFGGDMSKWIAFANTLRMNAALRLSNVDPATASSEFSAAYGASGGLITEDVKYVYLAESANQNPWYERYLTRIDYALSEEIMDHLQSKNDPRLPVYADPTEASVAAGTPEYIGMPYGVTDGEAGEIPYDAVSLIGSSLRAQDAPGYIFTMAQVYFAEAEAAQRGWISGTASTLYYQAIQASMEQYGVYDAASFDSYIAQAGVAWNPTNAIELISEQKWLALYLCGYEAWSEWRRLGYPVLTPAPAAAAGQDVPIRFPYSTEESELNGENYAAAVAAQGGNITLSTPVWWDN